jgi:hypothetical protein
MGGRDPTQTIRPGRPRHLDEALLTTRKLAGTVSTKQSVWSLPARLPTLPLLGPRGGSTASDNLTYRHRVRSGDRGHSGRGAILSQVAHLPPKEPHMIEDLSDEELLAEWEKTKAVAGSAPDGPGPLPTHSETQHRRHMAVEAELKRRGFGENPPGQWTRLPM